jgi:hypothetical protein
MNLSRSLRWRPWRFWSWLRRLGLTEVSIKVLEDTNWKSSEEQQPDKKLCGSLLWGHSEGGNGVVWPDFGSCFLQVMVRGCCIAILYSWALDMMIPMTCLEVKRKRTLVKLLFVCHFIFAVNLSFGWVSRQSQSPRGLRRGSAAAPLLRLRVRIQPGHECLVSVVHCQVGLCFGHFVRSEESYRVLCVWMWSWSLDNEEALAH